MYSLRSPEIFIYTVSHNEIEAGITNLFALFKRYILT